MPAPQPPRTADRRRSVVHTGKSRPGAWRKESPCPAAPSRRTPDAYARHGTDPRARRFGRRGEELSQLLRGVSAQAVIFSRGTDRTRLERRVRLPDGATHFGREVQNSHRRISDYGAVKAKRLELDRPGAGAEAFAVLAEGLRTARRQRSPSSAKTPTRWRQRSATAARRSFAASPTRRPPETSSSSTSPAPVGAAHRRRETRAPAGLISPPSGPF